MNRSRRLWVRSMAAPCCLLAVTACSLLRMPQAGHKIIHQPDTVPLTQRIAQLDFGRNARFALCTEPACPALTPKTLVTAPDLTATPPPQDALRPSPAAVVEPIEPSPMPTLVAPPHQLTLHFAPGSTQLNAAHTSLLRGALAELRKADRIAIVGRTDDLGSDGRNQSVAVARAFAVREYLRQHAPEIPAAMSIDAKGRCCYAAPNDTSKGRAQNRRVEIVFSMPGEMTP